MSSNGDPALQQFLLDLATHGAQADPGQFTLDPERAVSMLRAQGRLSQSGPLPLLSAIYTHTGGAPIELRRSSDWRLCWPAHLGPLASSVELLLGAACLQAQGIELRLEKDHVRLTATGGVAVLERVFEAFWDRLTFYPWKTPIKAQETLLFQVRDTEVEIDYYPSPAFDPFGMIARPAGRFVQVLRGISYPRKWALPVDAVLVDELSRPDFSMTVVPESPRRDELQYRAAQHFRQELLRELGHTDTYVLHERSSNESLPLFARSCAYALEQSEDEELSRLIGQKVAVCDATGHLWNLEELSAAYRRWGTLLVVEPQAAPQAAKLRQDRPVLRWGGQIREALEPLFPLRTPGDGYLYTLAVNETERQRLASGQGERRLASTVLSDGSWSLLPWGEFDRVAELEFVGPRRARETFYLDSQAPKGLRLLWESERPLNRGQRELALGEEIRAEVLVLLSNSLRECPVARETVLAAVEWAVGAESLDWSRLEELENAPLLERVDGGYTTLRECREKAEAGERLPVLSDRSTSVPEKLPCPDALWDHTVFQRLGFATHDVNRLFRESHWRESGRQRWLANHEPSEPTWPEADFVEIDGHRVGLGENKDAPTRVMFWREGRPFGSITLDPEACRPGFRVLWVEDDLPGDVYWSGPEFTALVARIPQIDELCGRGS